MKFQIVVDSSTDMTKSEFKEKDIGFSVVPLTIRVGEKEFVDNEQLDTSLMLSEMKAYSGKSTTACPSPGDFLEEFKKADYTFCVTITSKLSGTYNSAVLAGKMAEEEGKHVHVIDSKAVSGVEILIVEKLVELIKEGKSFEEIIPLIEEYRDSKHLFFVLQSFDNLIKNGRMSKFTGLIASVLNIKPLCIAKDGDIKIFEKIRNSKASLSRLVSLIGETITDFENRKVIITECDASQESELVSNQIKEKYKFKEIIVKKMKGLSSFYALNKGVIVCF